MTSYKYRKMIEYFEKIQEKKEEIKELEKIFNKYKDEFIKENEADKKQRYQDFDIYYKNVESKRLDSTRLKKENIDIYNKYIKSSISIRFYIKEV